jgi:hypothetical protein
MLIKLNFIKVIIVIEDIINLIMDFVIDCFIIIRLEEAIIITIIIIIKVINFILEFIKDFENFIYLNNLFNQNY